VKYVILGYGKIGRAIVNDFLTFTKNTPIEVYDPIARMPPSNDRVQYIRSDPMSEENRKNVFSVDNVIVSALPANLRGKLMRLAIQTHSRLVDVTFGNDDVFSYSPGGESEEFLIIPDCGLAPGISNLLVGALGGKFDELEDVRIYVGGIPDNPIPPLEYKITFSADSVIDEYVNPARIIENGKTVVKEALSSVEQFQWKSPELDLEAFLTDGLRTLLTYRKRPRNMFEKTVRYRGHAEKVRLLRDLGLFNSEKIAIGNITLSPRAFTERILDTKLRYSNVGDLVLLKVELTGKTGEDMNSREATLFFRSSAGSEFSAMAITTGSTAAITAQLVGDGIIRETGVVPMEQLGSHGELFKAFIERFKARGLNINLG